MCPGCCIYVLSSLFIPPYSGCFNKGTECPGCRMHVLSSLGIPLYFGCFYDMVCRDCCKYVLSSLGIPLYFGCFDDITGVSRLLHACSEQPQQTLNMPLPFTYNHCTMYTHKASLSPTFCSSSTCRAPTWTSTVRCTHAQHLLVPRFAVPADVGPLDVQSWHPRRC